jgi:VWFA-related protein
MLLCLIPSFACAQESRNVAIDAIVTGAGGAIVPGLTASDFEIVQEGQKQKIVDVTFVHSKSGIGPSVPVGGPVRWAGMKLSQDARNMMVIVVDDLGLSRQGWITVRAAIAGFVNEKLHPEDFLAIVPVSGGPVYLQQFTAVKDRLHDALMGVKFHPESATGPVDPRRAQTLASTAVLSLESVLKGLRVIPGRKTVFLISENMWLYRNPEVLDWFGRYDEHGLKVRTVSGRTIASLTESANLAAAVFYTLDPRGLMPGSAASKDTSQIETFAGIGRLAKDTGGIFFDNTNDVARALERVEQELHGYYKIVFSSNANNASGNMPFLRATVKVLRDGLNVRSRSGLLKTTEASEGLDPGNALIQMMESVSSPFLFGELRIGLNAVFLRSALNEPIIDLLLQLRMEDISYVLQKDGTRRASVEVLCGLVYEDGAGGERIIKGYEMRLKPEEYERVIRYGLPIRASLAARRPGIYRVVATVRDLTSGKIGSAGRYVDVPTLHAGMLQISGVAVSGDQSGFALDASSADGKLVKNETLTLSPVWPSRELKYAYQVFNAKLGEDKIARLDTSVRLFRNGEAIFSGDPYPVTFTAKEAAMRMTVSGKLRFKENIAPGEYSLQVVLKDRQASEGAPNTASQYINFEVNK